MRKEDFGKKLSPSAVNEVKVIIVKYEANLHFSSGYGQNLAAVFFCFLQNRFIFKVLILLFYEGGLGNSKVVDYFCMFLSMLDISEFSVYCM